MLFIKKKLKNNAFLFHKVKLRNLPAGANWTAKGANLDPFVKKTTTLKYMKVIIHLIKLTLTVQDKRVCGITMDFYGMTHSKRTSMYFSIISQIFAFSA